MRPAARTARTAAKTPRVAVLVDTSTSWGRRVITGIHNYTRNHGTWQLIIEARGMEERTRVPQGWRGEGIIARVSSVSMARDLRAHRLPVVNVSGIQLTGRGDPPRAF